MSTACLEEDSPFVRPRAVRVSNVGILTCSEELLVIDDAQPRVGSAVCLRSGGRLAYRRVLAIEGEELVVRCDVAPFSERWSGGVVGCVRPRLIDRLAAIDPARFTAGNWQAAVASGHLLAAWRRLGPRRRVEFTTEILGAKEWPAVRAFWLHACGRELPVAWQTHQHVIGLFHRGELVGVNVQLVVAPTSFSAFTLVDRRYRGMGGGHQMIKHALKLAETLSLVSMNVHISARNIRSLAAYQRAGFKQNGWWSDESDPLASAERQWLILERELHPHEVR